MACGRARISSSRVWPWRSPTPPGLGPCCARPNDILSRFPSFGRLAGDVGLLREQANASASVVVGASALTAAELRLLPYLSTYLSFREIGERVGVSANTIKSQTMSIYRKLDVSSRGDAIARAAAVGLTDPLRDPGFRRRGEGVGRGRMPTRITARSRRDRGAA